MRKIKLTQNKYALVDDEDFEYLNQLKWCADKGKYTYYAKRSNNKLKKSLLMHRVIMKCPNGKFIDHKDGNGLNNQKENLRVCTSTQNNCNTSLRSNNKSGIKGVSWDKISKKWLAQIQVNGKVKNLGRFNTKLKAKNVYTKAAKENFGEFYSDGVKISV